MKREFLQRMFRRLLLAVLWLAGGVVNLVAVSARLVSVLIELVTDEADSLISRWKKQLHSRESERFGKP